ncbi:MULTISPECIES: phosphate signaling complex protein PhoU [unclassified Marinitoga]|uniref:phosphate signaling complex protein PhoU n=1 Tax=unclassified Marinitoga TaxID=2640159 RepID=UPI0006416148|nr:MULTISPECIES: phosphate signaling complex protein PhoU [unclassified Marinitoga]KLO22167.1 PhoU family transcriptional regulator [Marinitoga sp. 1155]NUV00518.1 PhoU family transcriptional regulator [Marinitoga sp. 1154]
MQNVHHFENEILVLKADISKMLSLVLDSFNIAIEALESNNESKAKQVINLDDKIDDINRKIEDEVYQIIARYNPLAKELRYIITMIKFSNNLERIGDLSCNIAQKVFYFKDNGIRASLNEDMMKMIGLSLEMLKEVFKAFNERNTELAIEIWKKDNIIDELEIQIRKDILIDFKKDIIDEKSIIPYALIARDIERVSDQVTNLCEEIVYIEKGEKITNFL